MTIFSYQTIVDRSRSFTSLDLMLDLEASEVRYSEQRKELQSLRRLHSVVRDRGARSDELQTWLQENEDLLQRLQRPSRTAAEEVSFLILETENSSNTL